MILLKFSVGDPSQYEIKNYGAEDETDGNRSQKDANYQSEDGAGFRSSDDDTNNCRSEDEAKDLSIR